MNELVTFLQARLAERETLARAVDPDAQEFTRAPLPTKEYAEFVEANWAPYVLADVESKQTIVGLMKLYLGHEELAQRNMAEGVLARLAAPHAAHPDYDSTWSLRA